jgi:DNA-binding IclR family transcriptional regulator
MTDRAVLWLEEVIATHGTTEGPGRVRIPLSQAALARATARSAGTVTYYVRCLGPLIERRDGTLIVDIAALAERRDMRRRRRTELSRRLIRRFGQLTADGSASELIDGDGPPTVREMAEEVGLAPSSVQRHLHALQDDGRAARQGGRLTLTSEDTANVSSENVTSTRVAADVVAGLSSAVASLADTARQLTDLAQQLLVLARSETEPANICAPKFAREEPVCAPNFAGFAREENNQTSSVQEKERKLSFFSERSSREFACEDSRDFADSLSREQLDTALVPLHEACKRYGNKPGFLDENGRRYLSRLSVDQLHAGVDQVIRKLKANTAIDRPFGLLVARAKVGDVEFFTPPPASPEIAVAEPEETDSARDHSDSDPAVDEAIARLSAAELDALDAEIATSLSPATLERLRGRPAQMARLRRLAWQRRGGDEPQEVQ